MFCTIKFQKFKVTDNRSTLNKKQLSCQYLFLQINRLLEILLESELNSDSRYKMFRDEEDKKKRTLLHYAAELGFLQVTQTLVKKCPLLAVSCENQRPARACEKKSCITS